MAKLVEKTSNALDFIKDIAKHMSNNGWQLVYPATEDGLVSGLNRVVLKGTTTEKILPDGVDADDPRYSKTSETVYLEIQRPNRLTHPDYNNPKYFEPNWDTISIEAITKNPTGEYTLQGMPLYDDSGQILFDFWRAKDCPTNQHFIQMRLVAPYIDPVTEQDTTYDATGKVNLNAKRGKWSKFSWYKDWELKMLDELYPWKHMGKTIALSKSSYYRDKPGIGECYVAKVVNPSATEPLEPSFDDGIIYSPVSIGDNNFTLPVRYWISCNNNRLILVASGDPTPNYKKYLIGFAYAGAIESYNESYDVVGNFALTTSASTPPIEAPISINTKSEIIELTAYKDVIAKTGNYSYGPETSWSQTTPTTHPDTSLPIGSMGNWNFYGIRIAGDTGSYIGPVSEPYRVALIDQYGTSTSSRTSNTSYNEVPVQMKVNVPANAKFIRVYMYRETQVATFVAGTNLNNLSKYFELMTIPIIASDFTETDNGELVEREIAFKFKGNDPAIFGTAPKGATPSSSDIRNEYFGIKRNYLGGSVEYQSNTEHGDYTANGVLDVSMLQSFTGLYFQRYFLSYITPNNMLLKDRYGFSKSIWTRRYHLSPMYIANGYEGYRGKLIDILICDGDNIGHTDPLIVPIEETKKEIIPSGLTTGDTVAWKVDFDELTNASEITLKVAGTVIDPSKYTVNIETKVLKYILTANQTEDADVEILFKKEEEYQFFKITAPFNALFTGPNTGYCGIAIKTE